MSKRQTAKKAILVTSAAFTLGLAGIGPINVLNTPIIAHADTTSDQAIKITTNGIELLNKDVFKFNPSAANALTKMGGQAFQDTVKAANNDGTMSVNNFARDMTVAGTSLIPYGGVIISPLIALLWPSDSSQANATKQLLDQVSKMIDGKIIDYDKESLSTDLNNAKNDLKSLENGLQSGSQGITPPGVSHAPEESDTYHRELANNANQSLRKLIENCKKSSFQTSELPIYTIAATAHLELLSFLVENGKKSTFNYSDDHMRDLKNDLAQAITDYRNHISDTNWSVFSKYHNDVNINNRLNEQSYTASTRDNPAFHVAYIAAKNTYVKNGGDIDKIRKVDDNHYVDITPGPMDRLYLKSHAPQATLKYHVYKNGFDPDSWTPTIEPNGTASTAMSFSSDDMITVTIEIDGREIVVLDGYKYKDIPKTPPTRSGEESIKSQWL